MLKFSMIRTFTALILAVLLLGAFPLPAEAKYRGRNIILRETQKISPEGNIRITISVPSNHHFAKDVESSFSFFVKDKSLLQIKPSSIKQDLGKKSQIPSFDFQGIPGQTIVVAEIRAFFCDDDNGICLTDKFRVKFRAEISTDGLSELNIPVTLSRRK